MGTTRRRSITDTPTTTNREVEVHHVVSCDAMESALEEVAAADGMYISHITTLGRKRYPGNRHWHLKQDPSTTGCLDVTYWPDGPLLWISMRNSEPTWVHESGRRLQRALDRALASRARR